MNFNETIKMFNYTNSDTLKNISNQAKKVLKTIENQKIIFMKEHYIVEASDDIGPYHHIWTFYVFTCNSNEEVQHLRFYREYNEILDKCRNNPYKKVNFTDFDFKLIQRIIKEEQHTYLLTNCE